MEAHTYLYFLWNRHDCFLSSFAAKNCWYVPYSTIGASGASIDENHNQTKPGQAPDTPGTITHTGGPQKRPQHTQ